MKPHLKLPIKPASAATRLRTEEDEMAYQKQQDLEAKARQVGLHQVWEKIREGLEEPWTRKQLIKGKFFTMVDAYCCDRTREWDFRYNGIAQAGLYTHPTWKPDRLFLEEALLHALREAGYRASFRHYGTVPLEAVRRKPSSWPDKFGVELVVRLPEGEES